MDFIIVLFYIFCGIIILPTVFFILLFLYLRNFIFKVQTEVPPLQWIPYPGLQQRYGLRFLFIAFILLDSKRLIAKISPTLVAESLVLNGTEQENHEFILQRVKDLDTRLEGKNRTLYLDMCEVQFLARPHRRKVRWFENFKVMEPAHIERHA